MFAAIWMPQLPCGRRVADVEAALQCHRATEHTCLAFGLGDAWPVFADQQSVLSTAFEHTESPLTKATRAVSTALATAGACGLLSACSLLSVDRSARRVSFRTKTVVGLSALVSIAASFCAVSQITTWLVCRRRLSQLTSLMAATAESAASIDEKLEGAVTDSTLWAGCGELAARGFSASVPSALLVRSALSAKTPIVEHARVLRQTPSQCADLRSAICDTLQHACDSLARCQYGEEDKKGEREEAKMEDAEMRRLAFPPPSTSVSVDTDLGAIVRSATVAPAENSHCGQPDATLGASAGASGTEEEHLSAQIAPPPSVHHVRVHLATWRHQRNELVLRLLLTKPERYDAASSANWLAAVTCSLRSLGEVALVAFRAIDALMQKELESAKEQLRQTLQSSDRANGCGHCKGACACWHQPMFDLFSHLMKGFGNVCGGGDRGDGQEKQALKQHVLQARGLLGELRGMRRQDRQGLQHQLFRDGDAFGDRVAAVARLQERGAREEVLEGYGCPLEATNRMSRGADGRSLDSTVKAVEPAAASADEDRRRCLEALSRAFASRPKFEEQAQPLPAAADTVG
eukprot:TRINITY_DN55552_c0_g1_i1.p1 TRINITY_DN55552_c0_g1~~TRINITY_DN55552_c0_g1_i1.p1  ORF type:complete len:577 (-),score=83.82 TRINITY_DN55552_c0_g1_i1:143-1873(-)